MDSRLRLEFILQLIQQSYQLFVIFAEHRDAKIMLPMHGQHFRLNIQIPIGLVQAIQLFRPSAS